MIEHSVLPKDDYKGSEKKPPLSVSVTPIELPSTLKLELEVSDKEVILELLRMPEGRDREKYAGEALKIGVLSLRQTRGEFDAASLRHQADSLLADLDRALENHAEVVQTSITNGLAEYFDPQKGRLEERIRRLVENDGELERVMQGQIGSADSELSKTLSQFVGEHSPLLKRLDPDQAGSVTKAITSAVEEVTLKQNKALLWEFSLDNEDGALSRTVRELDLKNAELGKGLSEKVHEVVGEFSLDDENSALSRMVKRVEDAHERISSEFSLDEEGSALSRMAQSIESARTAINQNLTLDDATSPLARLKRELEGVLQEAEQKNEAFREDVKQTLTEFTSKRKESLKSTRHGGDFEAAAHEYISLQAQKAGDLPSSTGTTTGAKGRKVGDSLIELGPEHSAKGSLIAYEAKEDKTYTLDKARKEIELARQNRRAQIGVFVFSKRTAPADIVPFSRFGDDIFVVWDSEDPTFDIYLDAALTVAKALCVRIKATADVTTIDAHGMEKAVIEIEKQFETLENIETAANSISKNSKKILDGVTEARHVLENKVEYLRLKIKTLEAITSKLYAAKTSTT